MNRQSGHDTTDLSARLASLESKVGRAASAEEYGGGLNLRDLVIAVWEGKWFIVSISAIAGAIAVFVTLMIPNMYKATAVLMPASESATSSLARIAGQLGGLASLAGLNLGAQDQASKTIAAMELIRSWGFQEQFIRDNGLEVPVFAAKGWNRETNQLVIDPRVYDVEKQEWIRQFDPAKGQTLEPSGWELYKRFSPRISIAEDPKTGFVTLSVEYYSPYLARDWVDKLVIAVNRLLQARDLVEATKSIEYLDEKMSQTSLVEIKAVLARLIEEQTKNLMLAQVSDEYVLRTLSQAKVPEERSSPKRSLICILATLAAGFIATACWLLWVAFRGDLRRTSASVDILESRIHA